MLLRPPTITLTDSHFPYTTLSRSLALLHRRRRHREVHGIGRQSLGRGLEAEPGPGGVLVEQADHGLAPQRRHLGDRTGRDLGEVVRSEEHTSELQSLMHISYAVFCLKHKNNILLYNINIITL